MTTGTTRATPAAGTLTVADRYRLRRELAGGEGSAVWDAHDELLHRDVAVKEIRFPDGVGPSERRRMTQRLLREARAGAALDTTAAVRVLDVAEQDGRPWVVMEVVRGDTLAAALAARRRFSPADVARIGLAMLEALEVAHRAGVAHCTVTPDNVIVGADGRIALTDFCVDYTDHEPTVPATDLEALGATLRAATRRRGSRSLRELVDRLTAGAGRSPAPEEVRARLEQVLREHRLGAQQGWPLDEVGATGRSEDTSWPLLVALVVAVVATALLASAVLGGGA